MNGMHYCSFYLIKFNLVAVFQMKIIDFNEDAPYLMTFVYTLCHPFLK